jgi:hypothetical protein
MAWPEVTAADAPSAMAVETRAYLIHQTPGVGSQWSAWAHHRDWQAHGSFVLRGLVTHRSNMREEPGKLPAEQLAETSVVRGLPTTGQAGQGVT